MLLPVRMRRMMRLDINSFNHRLVIIILNILLRKDKVQYSGHHTCDED